MNREVHVRFCEGVGVKFPRATRPFYEGLVVKPSFGVRGFVLAFHYIFV